VPVIHVEMGAARSRAQDGERRAADGVPEWRVLGRDAVLHPAAAPTPTPARSFGAIVAFGSHECSRKKEILTCSASSMRPGLAKPRSKEISSTVLSSTCSSHL
jgi:hypothetical protein